MDCALHLDIEELDGMDTGFSWLGFGVGFGAGAIVAAPVFIVLLT